MKLFEIIDDVRLEETFDEAKIHYNSSFRLEENKHKKKYKKNDDIDERSFCLCSRYESEPEFRDG